ncbi:hypothetical protein FHW36_1122 [Chitinophaga polysaccharea]|uniref:Uncharacterized protein n=1 Tax=Chitinophaga polysaccharea TaxID=1293035 RepID=A0A561P640_9BACT|nr:hypothetical protein FHW36_1122 [Chitinophaga polysaccharea]
MQISITFIPELEKLCPLQNLLFKSEIPMNLFFGHIC